MWEMFTKWTWKDVKLLLKYFWPEMIYWAARITKRCKKLYEFVIHKVMKFYCRLSSWYYNPPNYLGRTYMDRQPKKFSLEWYKYEKYGIIWKDYLE